MSEPLTYYETADYQPFRFDEAELSRLHIELDLKDIPTDSRPGFIDRLERAIAMYKTAIRSDLGTQFGETRNAMRDSLKALDKLERHLKRLETGLGEGILRQAGFKLPEFLQGSAVDMRTALSNGADMVPVPKSRPHDTSEHFLLRNVAEAISAHLGQQPTATREGLYESVLAIVLQAATGTECNSLNKKACRGIALFKEKHPH